MQKLSWLKDSMKTSTDPVKASQFVASYIAKNFAYSPEMISYGSALSLQTLLKGKMGNCLALTGVSIFAMRSMGIPVVTEIIPKYIIYVAHESVAVVD